MSVPFHLPKLLDLPGRKHVGFLQCGKFLQFEGITEFRITRFLHAVNSQDRGSNWQICLMESFINISKENKGSSSSSLSFRGLRVGVFVFGIYSFLKLNINLRSDYAIDMSITRLIIESNVINKLNFEILSCVLLLPTHCSVSIRANNSFQCSF